MKLAAITKIKHGELFLMLSKLGWSQSDLAQESGLSPNVISEICTLKRKPSLPIMQAIQAAFGKHGHFLDLETCWPEGFQPLPRSITITQIKEVELNQLHYAIQRQLEAGDQEDLEEKKRLVLDAASTLPAKYRNALCLFLEGESDCDDKIYIHNMALQAARRLEYSFNETPEEIDKHAKHVAFVEKLKKHGVKNSLRKLLTETR